MPPVARLREESCCAALRLPPVARFGVRIRPAPLRFPPVARFRGRIGPAAPRPGRTGRHPLSEVRAMMLVITERRPALPEELAGGSPEILAKVATYLGSVGSDRPTTGWRRNS